MFEWLIKIFWPRPAAPAAQKAVSQRPAGEPSRHETPYSLAREHVGTREIPGKKHNPKIVQWMRQIASWVSDDETPWCAGFVGSMADEAGYEHTGKLNARSYLDVGTPIDPDRAKPGDVVIFSRGNPKGWQGHVGFLAGPITGQHVPTLGGNQSNEVNITNYDRRRLLGVRRLRPLSRLERTTA